MVDGGWGECSGVYFGRADHEDFRVGAGARAGAGLRLWRQRRLVRFDRRRKDIPVCRPTSLVLAGFVGRIHRGFFVILRLSFYMQIDTSSR